MSTAGARAGLKTFDGPNIDYEKAHHDNRFKVACIQHAISLLPAGAKVLDVGCGTGKPVSALLAQAGFDVHGFDISPKMIEYAAQRVRGTFTVADMLEYQPPGPFAGVFIIFSHLQLRYADFHAAAFKYARQLAPGGLLAIGQMPGDRHVRRPADWDATDTWVEDYPAPFMGAMLPTLMLSAQGQRSFLRAMGLEIVSDTFQPDHAKCVPEVQQYILARRWTTSHWRRPSRCPST